MAGMTGTWDPDLYLKFAAYRARPVDDLLPRLVLNVPGDIYDLGCGPGTLTKRLKDKWPERRVIGVDSSQEMLANAKKKFGDKDITWTLADISTWQPAAPPAMVFANASLQWVTDHKNLLPRLMKSVAAGGLLAVQMPISVGVPYQETVLETINAPRWRDKLKGALPHEGAQDARLYYDLLAPHAAEIDTWNTDYHHVLSGENPVTAWVSGTALVPFTSLLDDAEKAEFLADYTARVNKHYPPQIDGKVLFTMRRLFVVAVRK